MTAPTGEDDLLFRAAVRGLERGDFSRLEPLFAEDPSLGRHRLGIRGIQRQPRHLRAEWHRQIGVVGRSTDGGTTWQAARMPGRANTTIWNFAVHAADPELVYASSVSGEVYRSTDGGAGWEKLGREFGEIRARAWTP